MHVRHLTYHTRLPKQSPTAIAMPCRYLEWEAGCGFHTKGYEGVFVLRRQPSSGAAHLCLLPFQRNKDAFPLLREGISTVRIADAICIQIHRRKRCAGTAFPAQSKYSFRSIEGWQHNLAVYLRAKNVAYPYPIGIGIPYR
jgi:hypothetical protein